MTERCHDPALDPLHRDLDLGLIARLTYSRRQDRDAVVFGEVLIAWVQIRLVPTGSPYAALEVVRNNGVRDAAEVLERPHVCTEPIRHRLGQGRLDVGVMARA